MKGFRAILFALFLALGGPKVLRAQPPQLRPVISMLTVCSGLNGNHYPLDSLNWFTAPTHSQIVLFCHMLFPLRPDLEDKVCQTQPAPLPAPAARGELPRDWHPPLILPGIPKADDKLPLSIAIQDNFYMEADWFGPDGSVIASLGNTMPARVSSDYIRLKNRLFIPHTFAMAIGTRDLRADAGQKYLPGLKGLYHIKVYVDGRLEGVAFFTMLEGMAAVTPGLAPSPGMLKPEEYHLPMVLPLSSTRTGKGTYRPPNFIPLSLSLPGQGEPQ